MVWMEADGKLMGDSITPNSKVEMHFWNLKDGDRICLISDQKTEELIVRKGVSELRLMRIIESEKYLRVELYRKTVVTGSMPALLTNPFYVFR